MVRVFVLSGLLRGDVSVLLASSLQSNRCTWAMPLDNRERRTDAPNSLQTLTHSPCGGITPRSTRRAREALNTSSCRRPLSPVIVRAATSTIVSTRRCVSADQLPALCSSIGLPGITTEAILQSLNCIASFTA
jgi:hypothetical protein